MAVFVPVSFMTGDTGRLFGEFGVTVAAAVGFSAFVALTHDADDDLEAVRERHAEVAHGRAASIGCSTISTRNTRRAAPRDSTGRRPLWIVGGALALFGVAVMVLIVRVFRFRGLRLPSELAPDEDRAFVRIFVGAPEGSSLASTSIASCAKSSRSPRTRSNAAMRSA